MEEKPRLLLILVFLSGVLTLQDLFSDRPRISVKNGHLSLEVPRGKNLSFRSTGLSFNDKDVSQILTKSPSIGDRIEYHPVILEILDRIDSLEKKDSSSRTDSPEEQPQQSSSPGTDLSNLNSIRSVLNQILGTGDQRLTGRQVRRAIRSIRRIKQQVDHLTALLTKNECEDNPCKNGGSCFDSFNGFRCECPKEFEGPTCESDVNECQAFAGTDLGCQNSATCVNSFGGYSCVCPANFFGIHCTERHDDCFTSSNEALCGHGTCVNQPRVMTGQPKYTCICDQGWTRSDSSPSCSVDINECTSSLRPVCSTQPFVPCLNFPGGFHCGHCPSGYTGNGQYCNDIDECETNNGGCSLSPRVECINTIGSRKCASCPPGFIGDGVSCSFIGICSVNNGGCHPLAVCIENSGISSSYRDCRCPDGFIGSGVGATGCLPGASQSPISCTPGSTQCVHGSCLDSLAGYTCHCHPGWEGVFCELPSTSLIPSVFISCNFNTPCFNGGTCTDIEARVMSGVTVREKSYTCSCPSDFEGRNCETPRESCGGIFDTPSGIIRFPVSSSSHQSSSYQSQQNCAWRISVDANFVVNASFLSFDIESSTGCHVDFLQVNDGPDASSHAIGRYCGSEIPSSIVSTHNSLYLWFRSDASVEGQGFTLQWNSSVASCGDILPVKEFGSITSPGYPGVYPHNTTCFWLIQVPLGKRITLNFATVALENHASCDYDFIQVFDGSSEKDSLLLKVCNSSLVAPITTSGSYALVHFRSDQSMNDRGFHLTYNAIPGIPGCGGLITSSRGAIHSPNFPDVYSNNIECDWIIRVHPNDRVKVNVALLDLEREAMCQYDFLEVRDGSSESAALMGRYCGSVGPSKPFISSSNTLWIKFRADASFAARGFRLEYETVCGGVYEGREGIVKSPFFPDPYPGNRQCRYLIRAPVGHLVFLQFLDFEVEGSVDCLYDSLEIRDGGSDNSSFVGKYCGVNLPYPFVSQFNEVLLIFRTDGSEHNKGFLANYSSIDVGCGGVLSENNGHFSSPASGPDSSYQPFSSCIWLIRAPEGLVIRLTFPVFSIEYHPNCSFDYLQVQDMTGKSLGRFCGTRPPPSVQSFTNEIMVTFKSDETRSLEGFTASYVFVNESSSCGGNFFGETGYIKSPGFPDSYPSAKDCIWTINAADNHQIHLNFTFFDIENHTSCDFDFLEIRNGADETSPLVGRFCGSDRKVLPKNLISHSNHLWMRFRSDSSQTAGGFFAYFDGGSTGCGGELTSPTGIIQSPNYPSPYGHNAECFWVIRVSQGSRVEVLLTDLDLESHNECIYDYLEFLDGSDVFAPSLAKVCHPSSLISRFTSTGNSLSLRFRSDVSQTGRGFRVSYRTNCTFITTGKNRGVIESPNFPNPYPQALNCSWEIQAPSGNNITFAFTHLHLEEGYSATGCEHDHLEIQEWDIISWRHFIPIKRFCGENIQMPEPFNTTNNQARVIFSSDFLISRPGFRLEWTAVGCGGEFIGKTSGKIISPNFPHGYPHNIACLWHIKTDPGNVIELRFSEFELEASNECYFDSVKAYAGDDISTSIEIASLCHRMDPTKPILITSPSNVLSLKLQTDSSVGGKGFTANFRVKRGGLESCGGSYMKVEKGVITSPNYPGNFKRSPINCNYYINVAPFHSIEMTVEDLVLPSSPNCSQNSLSINMGYLSSNSLLLKACSGSVELPAVVTSESNAVVISLNSQVSAKGFKMSFRSICGGIKELSIMNSEGTFTSPNYPHGSINMKACNWTFISKDISSKIVLTFPRVFGLADSDDCEHHNHVVIKDGLSDDAPVLGRICRNLTPLPFVSSGPVIRVEMFGTVIFRAMYSTSTSSCGGTTLTSAEGFFASPGYPSSYPSNTECIWLVKAPQGNRVSLSILDLDIEDSEYCNTDYLEIRERSSGGKLVGRFCGRNRPLLANVSDSNVLFVKFKSDSSGSSTGSGFSASFNLIHGVSLSGERGTIESPGYPWGVFSNPTLASFKWTITTPAGTLVQIVFDKLELSYGLSENCYQYVKLYDGPDETYPLLGEFCGMSPPTVSNPIVSHANVLTVVYNPQDIVQSKFVLKWEAMTTTLSAGGRDPFESPFNYSLSQEECVNQLVVNESSSTTIDSPGYPSGYPDHYNCSWLLSAHPGFHWKIKVLDMNIEGRDPCPYDRITIFEEVRNSSLVWTEKKKLCGRRVGTEVDVFSSRVKINFYSDAFYNYSGFRLIASRVCGGNFFEDRGVISNYFNHSSVSCESSFWKIHVRNGRTIRFTFRELSMGNQDASCPASYVLLRNGMTDSSPFLGQGRFCGTGILPVVPETSSSNAYVQFVVNDILPVSLPPRFVLSYEEVSVSCGSIITLSDDEDSPESYGSNRAVDITSPGYPSPPRHDMFCDWTVIAPVHRTLRIDFEPGSVMSQCNITSEYLQINDGGTIASPLIQTLCLPISSGINSIKSSGQMIFMRMVTSGSFSYSNFKARVSIDDCGGTYFVDFYERLSGPIPGKNYSNNMDCRYIVRTKSDYALDLSSLPLDVINSDPEGCTGGDFIEVRDSSESGDLLGRYCGNQSIDRLSSESNVLFIWFKSDYNLVGRGFDLINVHVNFRPCGGIIDDESGVITSPGFPSLYAFARKCVWRFNVPRDKKIKLSLEILNLKKDPRDNNKCLDKLSIVRKLLRFISTEIPCNQSRLNDISFTGNVELVLETKGLAANEGFKLSYALTPDVDCGGLLTESSGVIIAPVDQKDVAKNESSSLFAPQSSLIECSWKIDLSSETSLSLRSKTVGIHFDIFEVPFPSDTLLGYGCSSGILTIGQTNRYLGGNLQGFCGNKTNFFWSLPSPSNSLWMMLVMNRTDGWRGIKGKYSLQECGGEITIMGDVNVTSPGYPMGYPPDALCTWIFRVSSFDGNVQINFNDFDLEEDCSKDFVQIKMGTWVGSPTLNPLCGSVNPGFFTSQQVLVLTMKTDSTGSKKGFSLTATQDYNGCGGHFKLPMSNLKSPNYPNDYDNNAECVWIIQEESSYKLQFTFKDRFDIEISRNCSNDYVLFEEFYKDNWVTLDRVCGHETRNTSLITRSHLARVTFRSNGNITASGFKLHYQIVCGGILSDSEGIITSPNYPEPHPPGLVCEWIIQKPSGFIQLNFQDFVMESGSTVGGACSYDSVTIFMGNSSASTGKYGPYCGSMNDSLTRDFISRDYMTLKMITDDSVNFRGFKAKYRTFSCGLNISHTEKDATGVLRSPDLPASFGGVNCTWIISVPNDRSIEVKVNDFASNTEGCWQCLHCDRLEIRDGNNSSSPFIQSFCSKTDVEALPLIKTSSNYLWIRFIQYKSYLPSNLGWTQLTDISNNELTRVRPRFEVVYRSTLGEKQGCGGLYIHGRSNYQSNKVIESPDSDQDNKYDSDLDCNWILMANEGQYFRLAFEYFELEDENKNLSKCSYDFLEIRDGAEDVSPLIDKMCGKSFDPVIVSSAEKMFIHFHSDSGNEARGFKMTFSVANVSCGGRVIATNETQIITSPKFPSSYDPLTRCRWHFVVDKRFLQKISLNFTVHETNCDNNDKIEFAFARGEYNPYRMCGRSRPPRLIGPNDLWMTFSSGAEKVSSSFRGFSLEYRISTCNETYTNDNGLISSPNFPLKRSLEKYCLIHINVETGRSISIFINDFDVSQGQTRRGQTSCSDAIVEVREGSSLSSPLLSSFCGSNPPDPVFSTTNQMVIYVKAPRTHFYNMMYTSSLDGPGCGGNITAFNGTFTSPWFPNKYNSEVPCRWFLSSQGHHSMTITFTQFDLTPTVDCSSNFLEIYEEKEDSRPLRFCAGDTPAPYISRSSQVIVKLVVNQDNDGRGFKVNIAMNQLEIDSGQRFMTSQTKGIFEAGGVMFPDFNHIHEGKK